jgi:hypothetical protein
MKMEIFSSAWRYPRRVIPAFASMTDPGGLFVFIPTPIFLFVTFVLLVVINLTSDISADRFN